MFFKIVQLYEDGRPLPRHRSITTRPTRIGQLRLIEEHSREFSRSVVFAILQGHGETDVVPRLHDAVVRHIADGCMTISGFETDPVTRECRGQSWFVQVYRDDEGD